MPILDPPTQLFLSSKTNGICDMMDNSFYLICLSVASKNIYNSFSTLETSIQFKKDLNICFPFIINKLKCSINEDDIKDPSIDNYYQLIYQNIIMDKTMKYQTTIHSGEYLILNDQFHTKLYRLKLFYDDCHHWFLSDTPIAILCLQTRNLEPKHFEYQSTKLEIDLLEACGYILVMCFRDTGSDKDFFFKILQENKFAEVHYNICSENEKYNVESFYKDYSQKYKSGFKSFTGYFYFYANFVDSKSFDERSIYKIFKHIPRVKIISFAGSIYDNFINPKLALTKAEKFAYCKNGFDYNYLRIMLSNVPLFISENDLTSYVPSETSDIGIGYISTNDFLSWSKNRVKILFVDFSNNNHHLERYINFDDIHIIRPDLYVNNQLALAKINQKTLKIIRYIQKGIKSKIKHTNDQNFQNEKIYSLFSDKKIRKSLQFVAFTYSYSKIMQGQKFFAHKTQIYAAYEACKKFINKKNDKNDKGIVFQVETGEGKICIVCIIAAALSLLKKKYI